MPIFYVTNTAKGVTQTNRVRVDETDPTKAAAEIKTSLAEAFGVNPDQVAISNIEPEVKPEPTPAQSAAPKTK
jgi:ribosomal protein L23